MNAVSHTGRKVGGQGLLLFGGFALAQLLSFGRNALLGHLLSKGDFGVAASLTLTLQMLEALSDVAVDRMIVQARDGGRAKVVAAGHALLLARGLLVALLLFAAAPWLARFFHVPDARWAFQMLALVPLIKAMIHLDLRRQQRHLNNWPLMVAEVGSQAAAFVLIWPLVLWFGDFSVVILAGLAQAGVLVALSHAMARRPYGLAADGALVRRYLAFGWPILLSAAPLLAVYYGDRAVIGHSFGLDVLGGYSAAFMMAMVPGLLGAKVGLSLVLPLLAVRRGERAAFARIFDHMSDWLAVVAMLYVAGFALAGAPVLEAAFGPNFAGYGLVLTILASMWGYRMLSVAPGVALMAVGTTRPLLVAGIIRAGAILPVLLLAFHDGALWMIALCGALGEVPSLLYSLKRLTRVAGVKTTRLHRLTLAYSAMALLAIAISSQTLPLLSSLWPSLLVTALFCALVLAAAAVVLPEIGQDLRRLLGPVGKLVFTLMAQARRPFRPAAWAESEKRAL